MIKFKKVPREDRALFRTILVILVMAASQLLYSILFKIPASIESGLLTLLLFVLYKQYQLEYDLNAQL